MRGQSRSGIEDESPSLRRAFILQGGLSSDCEIIREPGAYTNPADFDLDGKVNIKDFAAFAETWLWQTRWSRGWSDMPTQATE
jgi:hypothetical protein